MARWELDFWHWRFSLEVVAREPLAPGRSMPIDNFGQPKTKVRPTLLEHLEEEAKKPQPKLPQEGTYSAPIIKAEWRAARGSGALYLSCELDMPASVGYKWHNLGLWEYRSLWLRNVNGDINIMPPQDPSWLDGRMIYFELKYVTQGDYIYPRGMRTRFEARS